MSVSQHSQPKTIYLFSTQKEGRSIVDNVHAHEALERYFKCVSIPYTYIQGCYNGHMEDAFLVSADVIPEDLVLTICLMAQQECYMIAENHKHGLYKAILVDVKSGAKRYIGYLREMQKDVIDALGMDFTYRPDIKKHFAVWPTDTTVMAQFEQEVQDALVAKRQADIEGAENV